MMSFWVVLRVEFRLGDGVRGARRLAGRRAGLPEDPHRRLGLVRAARGRVVGVAGEAVGRERDPADPEDRLVDGRGRAPAAAGTFGIAPFT